MTDPMVVLGTLLIGFCIGLVAGVALAVYRSQEKDVIVSRGEEIAEWQRRHIGIGRWGVTFTEIHTWEPEQPIVVRRGPYDWTNE